MFLTVEIRRGARAGARLRFDNPTVIRLGRDPASDVTFDPQGDRLVSTHHAELRVDPRGYVQFVDLGSANGSFVAGSRVTELWLAPGAEVELGQGGPVIAVWFETGVAAAAGAPAGASPAAQGVPVAAPQATAAPQAPQAPQAAVSPQAQQTAAAPQAPQAVPGQAASEAPSAAEADPLASTQPIDSAALGAAAAVPQAPSAAAAPVPRPRPHRTRSTEFFRTLVDKEIRQQNKGLFLVTVLLGVLLLAAIVVGGWVIFRQRSDLAAQKDEIARRDRAHKDALAAQRARTEKLLAALRAEAEQRQKKQQADLERLKRENEAIKAMAEDKGPAISKANRSALYLLAFGPRDAPRRPLCTAFSVQKRILATNAHCLVAIRQLAKKGAHFWAVQNENPRFRAKVVAMRQHPGYTPSARRLSPDLGLLQVDRDLPQQVRLADEAALRKVERGSLMFSFGFPGRLADPSKPIATLVHGRIGRLTRFDASRGDFAENQLLQHSALSMGGASGSPLFDGAGRVIGVHAGSYTTRSAETVVDPKSRATHKLLRAERLGYKFGIRIDALAPLLRDTRWKPIAASGSFSALKLPAPLRKVDCRAYARHLHLCTRGKVNRTQQRVACEAAKRTPTPQSVRFLRFAACVLGVKDCSKSRLKRCVRLLQAGSGGGAKN